jgi:poly(A) polymerase
MMNESLGKLMACEDLRVIAALAAGLGVDAFLVGGCVRDHLLGRATRDLDFALSGACRELPAAFAEHVSGSFFWLDEVRQQARVVLKSIDGNMVYDFAPLAGISIGDDLRHRDFTINAMAMPLERQNAELIDPLQGKADLHRRVIRACGRSAFDDDPLRLMRAIRFSAELGFAIEDRTWEAIRLKAGLLKGVAPERVREELFRTIAIPGCGASLRRLGASGLWPELSPVTSPETFEERVSLTEEAERLSSEAGLALYLDREVEGGVSLRSLIKMAAFLDCNGKGIVTNLAERLRLGRESVKILGQLCRDDGRVFQELERIGTERSMFRFFRDWEPAGLGVIIVARVRGAISITAYTRFLHYFTKKYDPGLDDHLLSGGDVMEILGIPPGKAVGKALDQLREAEAGGVVNSKEEARSFIKNLLTKEEPMG